MKKILLILSVLAITNITYAQKHDGAAKEATSPTEKSAASSLSATTTSASTSTAISQSKEVQDQIKELLVENEDLGSMAIGYLKSDHEAKSSLSKIYSDNKGSVSGIMKSVMSDPKLSSKVMDWVNNNPRAINKAMSLLEM